MKTMQYTSMNDISIMSENTTFDKFWWRNKEKLQEAIDIYITDIEIYKNLGVAPSTLRKWRKLYNIPSFKTSKKRFCKNNHDTFFFGRNINNYCNKCNKERIERDIEKIREIKRKYKKSYKGKISTKKYKQGRAGKRAYQRQNGNWKGLARKSRYNRKIAIQKAEIKLKELGF